MEQSNNSFDNSQWENPQKNEDQVIPSTSQVEPETELGLESARTKLTKGQELVMGGKSLDFFFKEFDNVDASKIKEIKEKYPNRKFIVLSSHTHNLDYGAAFKVFGEDFDMQLTGESVLQDFKKYPFQAAAINWLIRDRFSPLSYSEDKDGKHGVFNPDNFTELSEKMEEGRTPWMAANAFSPEGKMQKAGVGGVYLANKTNAVIIPVALNVGGGSASMEEASQGVKRMMGGDLSGIKEIPKSLKGIGKQSASYHIGEPMELSDFDMSGFDNYFEKRRHGEPITKEDREGFKAGHAYLKTYSEKIGLEIAGMLSEERRGYYADKLTQTDQVEETTSPSENTPL